MKRDYIEFQARNEPTGYLITFRTYGTWLHGDDAVRWIAIIIGTELRIFLQVINDTLAAVVCYDSPPCISITAAEPSWMLAFARHVNFDSGNSGL